MYKTDIEGNIKALIHEDVLLSRRIDDLDKLVNHQNEVIDLMLKKQTQALSLLVTKMKILEQTMNKIGAMLYT